MASWMKKTGMLFPTMSVVVSNELLLDRTAPWPAHTKIPLVGITDQLVSSRQLSREMAHSQSGRKTMDIPGRIGTALGPSHRRKPDKHGRLLPGLAQERRSRDVAKVTVALESTVRTGSPRMNNSLGYLRWLHALVNNPPLPQGETPRRTQHQRGRWTHPFVVKVLHLLAVDEVLHERGAPRPGLETALLLDGAADVRGHVRALAVADLVLAQEAVSLGLPVGGGILPLAESFGLGVGACCCGEAEQTA